MIQNAEINARGLQSVAGLTYAAQNVGWNCISRLAEHYARTNLQCEQRMTGRWQPLAAAAADR